MRPTDHLPVILSGKIVAEIKVGSQSNCLVKLKTTKKAK